LFCAVFGVDTLCPVATSFDSRWTIPTTLSLLDRGDTNLDEYAAIIEPGDYSVERVGDHYYNWYPVAVPLIAAPVVFAMRIAAPLLAPVLSRLRGGGPVRDAFLRGDFLNSRTLVEVLTASFFVALTAVVLCSIGRLYLPDVDAALLALVFAFGTSAWS